MIKPITIVNCCYDHLDHPHDDQHDHDDDEANERDGRPPLLWTASAGSTDALLSLVQVFYLFIQIPIFSPFFFKA